MPNIFKALASITTWVLFIFGCLAVFYGFIRILMGSASIPLMTAYFGFGIASLVLGTVTAKIRKSLD